MTVAPPLANVITLGITDLARMRQFYRDVGWPQIVDDDEFAAFELGGIVLALFPVDRLASDGNALAEPAPAGCGSRSGYWWIPHPKWTH